MLILLPPSETKRSGGEAVPLDWTFLAHQSLNVKRRVLARALVALARNPEDARAALKLGRTQLFEIDRNRELLSSPTLAVIDRYTGVCSTDWMLPPSRRRSASSRTPTSSYTPHCLGPSRRLTRYRRTGSRTIRACRT